MLSLTDGIRTRVWERGSGITMACGTGACATAVAAALTGRAGSKSQIVMDGGTLSIEWRESDNHVYMTGPAEFVFDGEIELPKLIVKLQTNKVYGISKRTFFKFTEQLSVCRHC